MGNTLAILLSLISSASFGASAEEHAGLAASLQTTYPDAQVVASCSGPLIPKVKEAQALVLFLPTHERVLLVQAGSKTFELGRRKAKAADRDSQELQCLKASEVPQRNALIRETDTVSGEITPKGKNGVVCHSDADPSFDCYEYDPAAKRFVRAGGWST